MSRLQDTMELYVSGWKFLKSSLETTKDEISSRFSEFQAVEVPHDWLIEDAKNLYEDSLGWYRNTIQIESLEGKNYQLYFEGVYMDCTLYINDMAVGDWKYGYSSFSFEITDYLKKGMNEVLLLVRHQSPNSRWYSGAGIYRNVYLKCSESTYLPINGTYVSTSVISNMPMAITDSPVGKDFQLDLETEIVIVAKTEENVTCSYYLIDEKEETRIALGQGCIGEETKDSKKKAVLQTKVSAPKIWSVKVPNCYKLEVELAANGKVVDRDYYTIGFRTMEFHPDRGFFLNGEPFKVHGVCEHHDLGCLGSAVNKDALRRQFVILKEMGVNGLRTSHNMPAVEFMELADEMGFVVMSEAFDMWERSKTTYDYGRFFIEWAKRDVESWIRRDRNHPSIMLWSIGNEIYDTHADAHGVEITKRLVEYVRAIDPKENAPITIGSNYMPWEGAQNCADVVKFAGYNYSEKYYEPHHKEHPDWIIYGSETASVVQSRGIYHFPLEQQVLADDDEQCSALGNSCTSWGAESIEKCITDDRDATFNFGMFLWTGFDYIGEPTPYHTKNSYFGQIDTAGFPKDAYYIFKAQWTDVAKQPMVHLYPYWDFNVGQIVDVRAATNAPCVELFVNGASQGKQWIDHEKGLKLLGDWKVTYEPGEIEAVAYDEMGNILATDRRCSFGDSHQIKLSTWQDSICADGESLQFITIEMLDEKGNLVENAVDYVTVKIEGPGRLLGMDNGDSTDTDDYKSNTRKLFSGKLLAVVGSTYTSGEITVTVAAKGIETASVTFMAEPSKSPCKEKDVFADWKENAPVVPVIPVRKIDLIADTLGVLGPENSEVQLHANVYPKDANDYKLLWKIVNDGGIEVKTATIEAIATKDHVEKVKLTAKGDGTFYVRCMAQDAAGKITTISVLKFEAMGLGTCLVNPYEFVSAGLYSGTIGNIGTGNEKGIATDRDGDSGVYFENIDFGEIGSGEVNLPIFALDDKEYIIDFWKGIPYKEGSKCIQTVSYQKPSIWNVYQPESYQLAEKFVGVDTFGFVLHSQKLHVKGFTFKYEEKAFSKLAASKANRVYGDQFTVTDKAIEDIGNNVTIEFHDMDFGQNGSDKITIWGSTPLEGNTIHMRFVPENGESITRMVEFVGNARECQSFAIEKITGKGRLDFVFLPGSQFTLEHVQFHEACSDMK